MSARPKKLTAARVRELLDCNPETGELWWRERPDNPSFNRQWAGKPAGALDPTTGYLRLMINGQHQYVHRIVWLHTKGYLPRKDLDHRDGDKTNCSIGNLRPATRAQNNTNRRSPSRKTDAPRGAWFNPKTGMFQVNIRPGGGERGQSIYLGAYRDREVAERAYREAAEELHGEFAFTERPAVELRSAA